MSSTLVLEACNKYLLDSGNDEGGNSADKLEVSMVITFSFKVQEIFGNS